MYMKRVMLTIRDLVILVILGLIPLEIGMAVNYALKGNFDFTFRYLSMILILAGGLIALKAFRSKGDFEIPKDRRAPGALYLWYTLFGLMSALLPISFIIHGAPADEETSFDLVKQLNAMLAAPLAEEIICRCLLTHIIKRGGNSKALCIFTAIATSAVWCLPHCHGVSLMSLRIIILGLTASIVYQVTGNLKLCILEHAANNIGVTIAILAGRQIGSTAAVVIFAVISAAAVTGLIREMAKYFGNGRTGAAIRAAAAMH